MLDDNAAARFAHADGHSPHAPVAIVGIGCRFPGNANSAASFWQLLTAGVDATVPVPADRWNNDLLFSPDAMNEPGTVGSLRGGFIDGIAEFDAGFFGISAREAAVMDPQQRMLLETSFNALEDGGLTLQSLRGRDVGVFVGIASFDYGHIQHSQYSREHIGAHTNTGQVLCIAANRISYCFDFKGPSLAVDTACSSSLTALNLACQSIHADECSMALVGGVNALLKPEPTIGFSRATMLAQDGRCKAFDASADGFARGEGAGVVVLKRLDDALRDRDCIYAVIKGTAVNQDGRTPSLTMPSADAQADMLRQVYRKAGIDPGGVRYIEAHGTGTPVGDPIEIRALGDVFGNGQTNARPHFIGSVKTNIGHLEAAAGIAGLIKAALAVHHGVIPPNRNFDRENPELGLSGHHFVVPVETIAWPDDGCPRRAGVNSFGFGGANAHAIVEEAPTSAGRMGSEVCEETPNAEDDGPAAYLLPISARSDEALQELALRHLSVLQGGKPAFDLYGYCRAAARRRTHHHCRLAVLGQNRDELIAKLQDYRRGLEPKGLLLGKSDVLDRPEDGPVFVFSGMGPQWWAMGRQLLHAEPLFRHWIERCDAAFAEFADWSLLQELTRDEASSRMSETQISQPANFALQVALGELWRAWGLQPAAIVGHSAGEGAAAYMSGMLGLEEAARAIYHRARLQHKLSGKGKMIAAALGLEDARAAIEGHDGKVSLAAINGASSVTLSGDAELIVALSEQLSAQNIFNRVLNVDVPFHSYHMDAIADELCEVLDGITWREPDIPLYSTVTGSRATGFGYDGAYWWRNVREPVMFAQAVEALVEAGHRTFLEIAPHPVLTRSVAEIVGKSEARGKVVFSLRRNEPEQLTVLSALAQLHVDGHEIDWEAVFPGNNPNIALPGYPWQREHHWQETRESNDRRLLPCVHPLLGVRLDRFEPCWTNTIDLRRYAFLNDHRFKDLVIFPAAGFIELALAAGRELHGTSNLQLKKMEIDQPLILKQGQRRQIQVQALANDDTISIDSRVAGEEDGCVFHMRGRIRKMSVPGRRRFDLDELKRQCPENITEFLYPAFEKDGLNYGAAFTGIDGIWRGGDEVFSILRPLNSLVPGLNSHDLEAYLLHPVLSDLGIQALFGTFLSHQQTQFKARLPIALERLRLYGVPQPDAEHFVYARRLTPVEDDFTLGDIYIIDVDGNTLVEFRNLAVKPPSAKSERSDWLYAFEWDRQEIVHGIDESWAGRVAPGTLSEIVQADIPSLAERFNLDQYYSEVYPILEAMTVAFVWEAFEELGGGWSEGRELTVKGVCTDLRIASQHERLTRRLLQCLEARNLLEKTDTDTWQVLSVYTGGPEAEAIIETDLSQPKGKYPEFNLLKQCGRQLARVLRGDVDPVRVLFPNGSEELTETVYDRLALFGPYNQIVEFAVKAMGSGIPENRPLRILEIGAGTGALASLLLASLPVGRIQYTFTDISPVFFGRAKEKFSGFGNVDYGVLDIERSPRQQGFDPESFDLVIAGDVLHATRNLKQAIAHANELLVPNGMLLLLEFMAPPFWVDVTFGMLKGWWAYEDTGLRADHCCLGPAAWQKLLGECGFQDINILSDRSDGTSVQSVILSRKPEGVAAVGERDGEGVWLLFVDRHGIGARVKEEFDKNGYITLPVTLTEPDEPPRAESSGSPNITTGDLSAMRSLFQESAGRYGTIAGVVYLRPLDAPPLDEAGRETLDTSCTGECLNVANILRAFEDVDPDGDQHLVLVTRDVQQIKDDDNANGVLSAPLWGLGRVAENEYPDRRITLIDLPGTAEAIDTARIFEEATQRTSRELEVALRGGDRYVARLRQTSRDRLARVQSRPRPVKQDESFFLDLHQPGDLSSFVLKPAARPQPGPRDVEIAVHHAGLNFRDLMKAMDIYPDDSGTRFYLGDECSGIVLTVGAGVDGLAPGDRVAAIARGFGSVLTTPADCVVRIPEHLSLVDAATIPLVFCTVWHALHELADIQTGERILIHAAAGGVGLAAVQIAQNAGAEIFATAGSDEKRTYLRSLGIQHVLNSRTLNFHDDILEATKEEGIDVVLNSLSGEFVQESLNLLRSYGRFVEIGKMDIFQKKSLNLYPFRDNLTYFAMDLERVIRQHPQRIRRYLHEVMQAFEDKALKPLPTTAFDLSDAEKAFRYMSQSKHIGKIVFDLHGDSLGRAVSETSSFEGFHKDASYLLTGGLGGFGLAVAQWMAAEGAGHLILAGRRIALKDPQREKIAAIEETGCKVSVVSLDVADEDQIWQVLNELCTEKAPLKGVIHMAMVLDDRSIKQQNKHSLTKVFDPKVKGAWNLHRVTGAMDLDFFVLFSSMAAIIGNPGQSNYAAANQFLETLAYYRRLRGLPALAIAWGPISDVGYVAEHDDIQQRFNRHGVNAFGAAEAIDILCACLKDGLSSAGVLRIDWQKTASHLPVTIQSSRFRHLAGGIAKVEPEADVSSRLLAALNAADLSQRQELVREWLTEQLAEILTCEPEKIDATRSLTDIGVDSLMAVELAALIEKSVGSRIPSMELAQTPTIGRLAARLVGEIAGNTEEVEPPATSAAKDDRQ
ncbi:polyketide synthase module [Rubidibacter lacunae KORDI 51-2]|uniref:Polyketide synthase module n=1 Tax=Rubidibacter lacunae KORDI 51-2 TaxID=582515 RepID=U5DIS4_9CHRO|nr:type I polyketide synthase [Rubidibacter lacunae]ERN40832.1 polyketide synthase module [Rubidibacter lacunae KORDI 51-2]